MNKIYKTLQLKEKIIHSLWPSSTTSRDISSRYSQECKNDLCIKLNYWNFFNNREN